MIPNILFSYANLQYYTLKFIPAYLAGVSGGLDHVSHLSNDLVLRLLPFLGVVHSESEA